MGFISVTYKFLSDVFTYGMSSSLCISISRECCTGVWLKNLTFCAFFVVILEKWLHENLFIGLKFPKTINLDHVIVFRFALRVGEPMNSSLVSKSAKIFITPVTSLSILFFCFM